MSELSLASSSLVRAFCSTRPSTSRRAFSRESSRSRCCRVSRSTVAAVGWSWSWSRKAPKSAGWGGIWAGAAGIGGLGGDRGAGSGNDFFLQAKPLSDVEASGGSGDAEAQLVGGSKGLLIEAYGSVEHSGVIRGVDLER